MENKDIKILNNNPVKMENRLKIETEKIEKIITKYENDSDPYLKIEQALRTIRNKSEDPIRLWIISNALDNLQMPEIALEFKIKADKLGYSVTLDENVNTSEEFNFSLSVNFLNNEDLENFQNDLNKILDNYKTKSYDFSSNSLKASTQTNEVAGMVIKLTLTDFNKLKEAKDFYIAKDGNNQIIKMLKDNINAGIWNSETEELTVKHSALKKWLKENSFIVEGQEFIYNKQDIQPWSMFQQTKEEERAKPEYTTTAVLKMTQDVSLLKFAYSQLATGDNDKDAKMIYNTYIKSDEDLIDKLKAYESYVMNIYEYNSQNPYSDIIYDMLKTYQVEPTDEDTKRLLSLIINKMTKALTTQIEYEKSVFALYTSDIKQAFYEAFKDMEIIEIVEHFKKAGFDIDNIDSLNFDIDDALGLPDSAKNLIRDAIKSIDYADVLYLDDEIATIVYTTIIAIVLKEMVSLSIKTPKIN